MDPTGHTTTAGTRNRTTKGVAPQNTAATECHPQEDGTQETDIGRGEKNVNEAGGTRGHGKDTSTDAVRMGK